MGLRDELISSLAGCSGLATAMTAETKGLVTKIARTYHVSVLFSTSAEATPRVLLPRPLVILLRAIHTRM
jgi:uncharacterized OsmC-like protein